MASSQHRFRSMDLDFKVEKEVGIQLTERQLQIRQQRAAKPFETRSNKEHEHADVHDKRDTTASSASIKPRSAPQTLATAKTTTFQYDDDKPRSIAQSTIARQVEPEVQSKPYATPQETATRTTTFQYDDKPRSSASTTMARQVDQKALLKKIWAEKRSSGGGGGGGVTRSAVSTATRSKEDQKALLRQMLASKREGTEVTRTSTRPEAASAATSAATSTQVYTDQRAMMRKVLARSATSLSSKSVLVKSTTETTQPPPEPSLSEATVSQSKGVQDTLKETREPDANEMNMTRQRAESETSNTNSNQGSGNNVIGASDRTNTLKTLEEILKRKKNVREEAKSEAPQASRDQNANHTVNRTLLNSQPSTVMTTVVSGMQVSAKPTYDMRSEVSKTSLTSGFSLHGDENYNTFFRVLQQEVSGDHTELWRSFQSLFHDVSSHPIDKPKRVKFDLKTKQMLTEMNLHLKRSSTMECVTETQLVNDKKATKDEPGDESGKRRTNVDIPSRFSDMSNMGGPIVVSAPTSLTTRQLLEANKRRLVAKELLTRQPSMESMVQAKLEVKETAPLVSEPQGEIEWPDNDSQEDATALQRKKPWLDWRRQKEAQHVEIVSSAENVGTDDATDHPSRKRDLIFNSQKERLLASATVESKRVNLRTTNFREGESKDAHMKEKPWLAAHRAKQAMKAKSVLDQTLDMAPEQSFVLEESRLQDSQAVAPDLSFALDESRSQDTHAAESSSSTESDQPRMSISRQTSLLDMTTDSENNENLAIVETILTPRTLAGTKRRIRSERGIKLFDDEPSGDTSVPWALVKLRPPPPVEPIDSERQPLYEQEVLEQAPMPVIKRDTTVRTKLPSNPLQLPMGEKTDAVPWSIVKLKSVTKPYDEPDNFGETEQESLLPFRQMLRKVPSAVLRKNPDLTTTQQVGVIGTNHGKRTDLFRIPLQAPSSPQRVDDAEPDCGISVGDNVDLTSLAQSDATVVKLDRTPGMPENHQISVVIGMKVLMIARSVMGETLSRVTWCLPRVNVRSLTLDMAENRADLALRNNSSKSLRFGSAEGCLLFANAFYHTSAIPNGLAMEQSDHTDIKDTERRPASSEESMSELLSEEEQKLLETYRQIRRTKAPEEAMRETMAEETRLSGASANGVDGSTLRLTKASQGVMPTTESSLLSAEEEKVAAPYRKMLKFSVPPEAVRHKMEQEGVSEEIIAAVLSSPSDEGKSDGTVLSVEEDAVAETYRKMLKLRIPPDAVRHKMTKDQIDERIVEAVLGSEHVSTPPANALSEDEENIALIYRKMLKMMLPPEAVRHKMARDQVSSKIVIAVLGPDPDNPATPTEPPSTNLSEEEESTAITYRKMLKMMIPPDAVRHKMTKDGVDPKIILVVLGPNPDEAKPIKAKTASELTEMEEGIAAQYRKMLNLKIPGDAVRHKMVKDEVSQKIISAVLGGDSLPGKPGSQAKPPALRGSNLVSLHWTPLSGEELNNSIWRASKKRKVVVPQPEGSDISKLVELFQKKTSNRSSVDASANGNSKGDDKAKLIDLTRANNVAISLKAFKDFTHSELAATIAHLDPLRKIRGERVQFVKDLLPTAAEAKAIKEYTGRNSRLVPAEIFFQHLVGVQRMQTKVHVMQTMDTFNDNATETSKKLKILAQVCTQVMRSEKLQEVLDMVLQVGNIMNEGTRTGGAAGFKFDSLLKLTQTKSADGKTTVLDYIVMIFVAKEKRASLQLSDDFPECQSASRMIVSDMVGEVRGMSAAMDKCRNELENLKKEHAKKTGSANVPATKKSDVKVAADPRAALFAAIQKRNSPPEHDVKANKPFAKKASFLAAIEARGTNSDESDDDKSSAVCSVLEVMQNCCSRTAAEDPSSNDASLEEVTKPLSKTMKDDSLESGIQRLEDFVGKATDVLKKLEEDRDIAIDACRALARYCGEGGGERATSTLLGILSEFASCLEQAVKKHDAKVEAEARKEALEKKKGPKTTEKTPTKGQSLVLMVNQMLRHVREDVKEDFKKGVVYENPDDKLRAIYQREQESLGLASPRGARPTKMDLLSAIKKRREGQSMTMMSESVDPALEPRTILSDHDE